MTYEETLNYMYESLPMYQRIGGAAYKADLENAYELDKLSGTPHKSFKTIHIAGTNGKGSVSHMLASVFQHAGYKTGLYTSPHLLDFRERIKVDGIPVSKEYVIKYIQRNQCFYEFIKPSFFEMTVFMAFSYFKTQKVDIAIIETGLGGRLDTTNIISPIASVITNIAHDHMQFLGKELKHIAKEKAGIIKPGIPAVIGETDDISSRVFGSRACLMESPVYFADQEIKYEYSLRSVHDTVSHRFSVNGSSVDYETDLLGAYQYKNIRTCIKALEVTKNLIPVTENDIIEGLKQVRTTTGLMGRWQEMAYNPLVVCDIAHNEAGIREIVNQLENSAYKKLHMILGFVNDKEIGKILEILPKDAKYYFTRADIPRSADPSMVADLASKCKLIGNIYNDVGSAYHNAIQSADAEDLIYIGGSTFIVADYLALEKK
ncbi:MAG: bifunctional folylpolyglutamate synthase/dihydrofolate synthase [Bacteroidales bacterium]|nr:bifunctional folylpolyglutamate synthase/dihydrofolate synthase [Bacteroidales bacterium]MBN2819028.1 bifunctional folylpolyglutamate synthase/dihydrofolate synthase [Bacteroidales bacterium]